MNHNDNDTELTALEAELRRLKPAPTPRELEERLLAVARKPQVRVPAIEPSVWHQLRRWLLPVSAAGLALGALTVWIGEQPNPKPNIANSVQATAPLPKTNSTDEVEIGRELLASFDAIAELPDGVPVRFQCLQYEDRVLFHNPGSGISIERSTPRLEIIPVRFETY